MSAREPFSIWRASAELAAKEKRTGIDVSLVNASPKSCSTLVREAAANTVSAFSGSAARDGSPKRQAVSSSQTRNVDFITASCAPAPASRYTVREMYGGNSRFLVCRNSRYKAESGYGSNNPGGSAPPDKSP